MAGGRKLEFDKNEALETAMKIFWEKGYIGASLSDLTEGMGIKKPSMYATFGNKEALFVQATEYYLENFAKRHGVFLLDESKPLKERLKNYLLSVIQGQCDESLPKGCYISLSVSEAASGCLPEDALNTINKAGQFAPEVLTEFFDHPEISSQLSQDTCAAEKALFVVSVLHGTAAMARAGKSKEELKPVAEQAIVGLGLPN